MHTFKVTRLRIPVGHGAYIEHPDIGCTVHVKPGKYGPIIVALEWRDGDKTVTWSERDLMFDSPTSTPRYLYRLLVPAIATQYAGEVLKAQEGVA